MTKYYVAVDIGCIECGEPSAVLGIFTDKDHAEEVLRDHAGRQSNDWCGEHSFELFDIGEMDRKYHREYE